MDSTAIERCLFIAQDLHRCIRLQWLTNYPWCCSSQFYYSLQHRAFTIKVWLHVALVLLAQPYRRTLSGCVCICVSVREGGKGWRIEVGRGDGIGPLQYLAQVYAESILIPLPKKGTDANWREIALLYYLRRESVSKHYSDQDKRSRNLLRREQAPFCNKQSMKCAAQLQDSSIKRWPMNQAQK